MRKTYKCSNIKFCMEDENQRRTWEYLQGLSRRDGSYGKILSDAFVTVLDGNRQTEEMEETQSGGCVMNNGTEAFDTIAGRLDKVLEEKLLRMQAALARQIESYMKENASAFRSGTDGTLQEAGSDGMGQVQEPELSEDMMAFALAMGE